MPNTNPSGDWETQVAPSNYSTNLPIKTIRPWADGTITFTDQSGKTTTDIPVFGGELLPVWGTVSALTTTLTISLLR